MAVNDMQCDEKKIKAEVRITDNKIKLVKLGNWRLAGVGHHKIGLVMLIIGSLPRKMIITKAAEVNIKRWVFTLSLNHRLKLKPSF